MNLSAIRPRRSDADAQAASDLAQRNRSAGHGTLLFRNTRPLVEVVARELASVKPVSPAAPVQAPAAGSIEGLMAVAKAMTDGFNRAAASIRAPIAKAVAPPPPPPAASATAVTHNTPLVSAAKRARRAEIAAEAVTKAPERATRVTSISGNEPYVPLETESQRRRAAEERAQAHKAAEREKADRVLVTKGGGRVRVLKKLDPDLSDAAILVLNRVVAQWEANDRRAIQLSMSGFAAALAMPVSTVQAAYAQLVEKHLVIASKDSIGVLRVQPGLGVTGA